VEKTETTERTDSQTEQRRKQRTNGEERFDGVAKRRTRTNRIGDHEPLESFVVRGLRSDPSASAGLRRRPAVEPPPFLLRFLRSSVCEVRCLRNSSLPLHRSENRIRAARRPLAGLKTCATRGRRFVSFVSFVFDQRFESAAPSLIVTTRPPRTSFRTSMRPLGQRTSIVSAAVAAPNPKCRRRSSCE